MEQVPTVVSFQIESPASLRVTFSNEVIKRFSFQDKLSEYPFNALNNESFFKSATIDRGGYGISWSDQIDISENELWEKGVDVEGK